MLLERSVNNIATDYACTVDLLTTKTTLTPEFKVFVQVIVDWFDGALGPNALDLMCMDTYPITWKFKGLDPKAAVTIGRRLFYHWQDMPIAPEMRMNKFVAHFANTRIAALGVALEEAGALRL